MPHEKYSEMGSTGIERRRNLVNNSNSPSCASYTTVLVIHQYTCTLLHVLKYNINFVEGITFLESKLSEECIVDLVWESVITRAEECRMRNGGKITVTFRLRNKVL